MAQFDWADYTRTEGGTGAEPIPGRHGVPMDIISKARVRQHLSLFFFFFLFLFFYFFLLFYFLSIKHSRVSGRTLAITSNHHAKEPGIWFKPL
jgi:hypothetical protein